MNRRTSWRIHASFVACSALLASLAHAQQTDEATLDLELGAEHSDNVTRVPVNEQSDTIGTARIGLALVKNRPRLEANIGADVRFQRYFEDTYGDEVLGGANAYLGWLLMPERFVWVIEDNYGQLTRNPLQADTPDNREQTNFFSTGPDITLPLGSRTNLVVSGRWSDNYFEESVGSNQSIEGTAGIARRLSEQSTASLNGSVREIQYDDSALFPDFTISEGFLRLESTGARTTIEADAGYTEAKRDELTTDGEQTTDGPLFRASVAYEITSRSTLSLDGGYVFTDSGTALRVDQAALGPGSDVNTTLAAGDVYRDTYAYLTFDTERERTGLSVSVFGRKERHEDQVALDRDIVGAGLSWSRNLTGRLDVDFEGSYSDEKFVTGNFAFQEWFVGLGLGWRLTPRVSLRASVYHNVGQGDGTSRDYEENTGYIGIRYSTGRGGQ